MTFTMLSMERDATGGERKSERKKQGSQQWDESKNDVSTYLLRCTASALVKKVIARPSFPARPVRPAGKSERQRDIEESRKVHGYQCDGCNCLDFAGNRS